MYRPGTPNTPSRHHPSSSPAHDGSAYQTALRGASLAFQRTGPSPGPTSNNSTPRNNGALIAATRISRQTTGNSMHNGSHHDTPIDQGAVAQRLSQVHSGQHQGPQTPSNLLLKPPGRPNVASDPRSTSFIAATLAASRSGSPSPSQLPQSHPYPQQRTMKNKRKDSAASSVASLDLATDTRPLPPTNTLISMFEKNMDGGSASSNTDPVKKEPKPHPFTPPRLRSPPKKTGSSPSRLASSLARERTPSPPGRVQHEETDVSKHAYIVSPKSKQRPPAPPKASTISLEGKPVEQPTQPIAIPKRKSRAITPPLPISRADTVILSPQPRRAASHKVVRPQQSAEKVIEKTRPKLPPPAVKPKPRPRSMHEAGRGSVAQDIKPTLPPSEARRPSIASSTDTFVSASSVQTSQPGSPRRGRSPSEVVAELPPNLPRRDRPTSAQSMFVENTPKRITPVPPPSRRTQRSDNTALNSLTAATMAGILASSRAPPPSSVASSPRPPSLPPPRKQTPHLRQTLRKPPSPSVEEEEENKWKARHRTKPLQSKKKHAHHEGARRRWREEITVRERKRYEGVWASNRGLLLVQSSPGADRPEPTYGTPPRTSASPMQNESELVLNIVVRDLWSRSRLPIDELAEVWDVVDRTGRGVLDKTEFVVGMWLVDQRLRGRKIPQKVTDSVWASAKGVSVRVPTKEKEKRRMHKHKHQF